MSPNINDVQRAWFEGAGSETMTELGFVPGQRAIDFGCGPGRYTVPLSRIVGPEGGRVFAVDRSQENLEQLARRLAAHGEVSAVETVHAEGPGGVDAAAGEPVDAVLAFDVLQHVDDWDGFFEAVHAALKPDGALYVYPAATPHPGRVDMDAVREAVGRHGFTETSRRTVHMPHANEMVEDVVYVFERGSA
jgi:cyclopropane fatty-acyl-phospholipid synthase-like methyltransferase